jgi:hypothetical protein
MHASKQPLTISNLLVTGLGNGGVVFSESLASVTIPGSVSSIGGNAFNDLTLLASVTVSDGMLFQ